MPVVHASEAPSADDAASLRIELEDRCTRLREQLRVRGLASDEELAAHWPGGAENAVDTLSAWCMCWGNYGRFMGRAEGRGGPQSTDAAQLDADVLAALRDQPEAVVLGDGRVVTAYPKSFDALHFLADTDWLLAWWIAKRDRLRARDTFAEQPELLGRIREEIDYLYGLMAWGVTHPDVTLPYPTADVPRDLPPEIAVMTALDRQRIYDAYVRVNRVSLFLLTRMLSAKTEGPDARPSFNVFFSARAEAQNTSVVALMRDRSLRAEVASAIVAAEAREQAMEAAKRRHDREHRGRPPGGGAVPASALRG